MHIPRTVLRLKFTGIITLLIFALLMMGFGCLRQPAADPLTTEERAWLTAHDGKIRLAHDPNARPIDYFDEDGNFMGLAADYVHLIEARLGFKFDILHIDTWEEVVRKAEAREVDVLCTLTKTEQRERWMLFTEPYIVIPTVILTRDDVMRRLTLDTMNGMTVTFTKGWVVDDYLRQNYARLKLLSAIDADEAMSNLIAGKADAWVTALTVASIKVKENRLSNIRIAGNADLSFKLSMASRKDWPILNRILEKGLAQITEKERSEIFDKWIHIKQQSIFESRNFWLTAAVVVFFTILPAIIVFFWNTALKRKVYEKTVALKTSEDRYRSLVEGQTDLVARLRPDGTFVYVNQRYCDFFGKTKESLIGSSWQLLTSGEDLRYIQERMAELSPSNPSVSVESRILSEKRDIHWVHFINTGLFDSDGNLVEIQSVGRDITERKVAEERVEKSEEKFRKFFQTDPSATFVWEFDGDDFILVEVNEAAKELTKDKVRKDIGKGAGRIYKGLPLMREKLAACYADKSVVEFEHRYESRSRARDNWFKFRMAFAEPNIVILYADKITDRKEAEQKIQFQARLLGSVGQSVIATDRHGKITYWNKCAEKLYGWCADDVLGEDLEKFNVALHDTSISQDIAGQTASGETWSGELNVKKKSGEIVPVWVSSTPYDDQEGNLGGIISVSMDITKTKALEARLQKAQRMESIGNLAGGIAHDFNNLLFPIVGMAELLMEDLPQDSPEHENAHEILKAGKRGSDLVKQILAFSRQAELRKLPVRIQQVLKEVFNLSRSTIPADIEISQDIQEDCGLVMADPTRLHQIAMNLITNAYHALEATGGKIEVRLREDVLTMDDLKGMTLQPGKYAVLAISDTGCGIDPEIVDKIFEPYFTTKERGKGTGLGLAVVYGIVKELGGDIQVASEMGKGTTFSVFIPLMAKGQGAMAAETAERLQTGRERILLVDDEGAIARLEKQMLERLGYQVTSRTSSLDALDTFRAAPDAFDMVVTDMTMPNMTGDQLAKELISIRPGLPVIICTGFSERIDRQKALSMGIGGFLMKPVVRSELAKTVREVLDAASGGTLS